MACKMSRCAGCLFFPIAFLLLLFLQPLPASPLDLRFRVFGADEGLSSEFVTHVFIDRLGTLWVCTLDGLNRFDGYSFKQYHHEPGNPASLSHDRVTWIADDYLGRLWVKTREGLDILDPQSGQFVHLGNPEDHWGSAIAVFREIRNREMWFGTMGGRVFLMDSAGAHPLPSPPMLRGDIGRGYPIAQIIEDKHGDVWMGCHAGLTRFSSASGELRRFPVACSEVEIDQNNIPWTAIGTTISRFDPASGALRQFPLSKKGYPDSFVDWMCLLPDTAGRLWFGTNLGLEILDARSGKYVEAIRFHGEPRNVVPKYITALCQDQAGNIWAGVFGEGICRINPRVNQFQFIHEPSTGKATRADTWVNCLLEDGTDAICIGSQYGGLSHFDPHSGAYTRFAMLPAFERRGSDESNSVLSICRSTPDRLWVGAASGLFLLDPQHGAFHRFKLPPIHHPPFVLPKNVAAQYPRLIVSIQHESANALWLSAYDEGIFRIDLKSRNSTLYRLDDIMPPSSKIKRVERLFLDRSRSIWACTTNGIFRFDRARSRFEQYLPGIRTICALDDRNAGFWIGTDQGLFLLDRLHGSYRTYNSTAGLGSNLVNCMTEDQDGYLWLGTSQGLSRFDTKTCDFLNYGPADGVALGGVKCLISCRNGRLIAGGHKGLLVFNPRDVIIKNNHVPTVIITAIRIGNRPVPLREAFPQINQAPLHGRLVLQPDDRVLAVEFSALDFSAPEKNRYAFRLDELGKEWNDIGTQHILNISNLKVGQHIIRVKGSNNDGVWNEAGVMLGLIVLPHFWQTWWFKLLACLAVAGLASAILATRQKIASLRRIAVPPNLDEIFNKYKVSQREREIIHLVIQGKSNRDMEQELFISLPTVRRHLANIYEKIGVSSRLQLINFLQGRKPRY